MINPKLITNPPPITTKAQMYALLKAGLLGNGSLTFEDPSDAILWAHMSPGRQLGIRSTVRGSPLFKAHMSPAEFAKLADHYINDLHVDPRTLVFVESPPQHHMLIQGEISEVITSTEARLTFEYTRDNRAQRVALVHDRNRATGLAARMLLKQNMDPMSYNCMWDLLDKYPGHVLELSMFDRPVGRWRWNTMFWEVRKY